jgi:CRP-like cAMP-binding protein
MSSNELIFKLFKESKCPFYKTGDEFKLSGNALLLKIEGENTFISTAIVRLPGSKQKCPILIGDLTKLLIQYETIAKIPSTEMACGGCGGTVRLQPKRQRVVQPTPTKETRLKDTAIAAGLLSNFSIFRSLGEYDVKDIIPLLKLKKYPEGKIVIKKGEPAKNLYIIISGAVDVLDEQGACLSTLANGDVFGEMSLISGDAVGATIKVAKAAAIVLIEEQDFKELLNKYASLQTFLARNLVKRLTESNILRAEEIASGMSGKLSELPALELLQALNLSQKTGVLTLTLSEGSATLYLRDGNLIKAAYKNFEGRQAICEAVKEQEGRFKFDPNLPGDQKNTPIMGPMMEILLDTSRMLDEQT